VAGEIAADLRLNSALFGIKLPRPGRQPVDSLGLGVNHFSEDGDLTQSDPTDEALATIASILEHPQSNRVHDTPTTGSPSIAPSEADGYTKIGPGPMASIRFKWSVRRGEHDEYFVDETIGESSTPMAIGGPMSAEAAMRLVDERESDAHGRFEQIRREMMSRRAAAPDKHEG
jgi:hypothetical protein